MRYNKCCVPGCNTRQQDAVILHKFPTCENRRNKWLDSINCASLRVLSVVELGKQCVCHKHFEARFLTQKSRLLMQAYPTLITEHETSTGVPTHSNSENQNPSSEFEHNYCRTLHVDHNYAASRPTESAPLGHRSQTLTSKLCNKLCLIHQLWKLTLFLPHQKHSILSSATLKNLFQKTFLWNLCQLPPQ